MAATSISVRKITKFSIPSEELKLRNASVMFNKKHTLIIGKLKFDCYKANFKKEIIDDIFVNDSTNEDYTEYNQYQKRTNFQIFYCEQNNLFFSTAPTPITKKILKELIDKQYIFFTTIDFNFVECIQEANSTSGIRFSSIDKGVRSKTFNGDEVDSNDEANNALSKNEASQITIKIDILNKSRTISLTKSGTIICYSSLKDLDNKENPMLELSMEVLKKLEII